MYSANFRDWLSFVQWYDWKSAGPTKISPIIINHLNLTLLVDKKIDNHTFAQSLKNYHDSLGSPDEWGRKEIEFVVYLLGLCQNCNLQFDNYNPLVIHSPQTQKAIYTVQGYLECLGPTTISSIDCNQLLKSVSNEAALIIPETATCLETGVRRGEVSGNHLEFMKGELYLMFDHIIDPSIKQSNPTAQQVHDGPKFHHRSNHSSSDRIYTC
jgi:hypothetical protein